MRRIINYVACLSCCLLGLNLAGCSTTPSYQPVVCELSPAEIQQIEQSAAQGDAEAQVRLGHLYMEGKCFAQDYKAARPWFAKAAERGSAAGQFELGKGYLWGRGGPQDYDLAFEWLRRAADQANADAAYWLGQMYRRGWGRARDVAEAEKWYRKAAQLGHPLAPERLDLIEEQKAKTLDLIEEQKATAKAVAALSIAAQQGDPEAQYELSQVYRAGDALPQDLSKAYAWLRKAAANGHAQAQYELSEVYRAGNAEDQKAMAAALSIAAQQGDPEAQYELSQVYRAGDARPQDLDKAYAWLRKAAVSGHAQAQYELSEVYRAGDAVPKDLDEAEAWLHRAAASGHPRAQAIAEIRTWFKRLGIVVLPTEVHAHTMIESANEYTPIRDDAAGLLYGIPPGVAPMFLVVDDLFTSLKHEVRQMRGALRRKSKQLNTRAFAEAVAREIQEQVGYIDVTILPSPKRSGAAFYEDLDHQGIDVLVQVLDLSLAFGVLDSGKRARFYAGAVWQFIDLDGRRSTDAQHIGHAGSWGSYRDWTGDEGDRFESAIEHGWSDLADQLITELFAIAFEPDEKLNYWNPYSAGNPLEP